MERLNIFDDAILWLSMLSIAAICLVLFYDGITGMAHVPSADMSPLKKAFSASVFILFILLPLLILDLVLGANFISNFVEWSTPLLYVAIIADIILMTILFLIM